MKPTRWAALTVLVTVACLGGLGRRRRLEKVLPRGGGLGARAGRAYPGGNPLTRLTCVDLVYGRGNRCQQREVFFLISCASDEDKAFFRTGANRNPSALLTTHSSTKRRGAQGMFLGPDEALP